MKMSIPLIVCSLFLGVPVAGISDEIKIVPSAAPPEAHFGSAVAISNGLIAVGAPKELGEGATHQAGAVYVFSASGVMLQTLTASDASSTYQFGRTVSVDQSLIVVGALYKAYVFRFDPDTGQWIEEVKLTGNCNQGNFGAAVAVSGNRILVGSPLMGCLGGSTKGFAYFYHQLEDGTWSLESSFNTQYSSTGDYYGWSVSMQGDTAVVGAPGWGQVFTYYHNGSSWIAGAVISDPIWGGSGRFGESVSLHGGRLVVGTPLDGEMGTAAGAAYAYLKTSSGWTLEGKLLPPVTSPPQAVNGSRFGSSVSVRGSLLGIGAPQSDTLQDIEEAGAVFLFRRQSGAWALETELNASGALPFDRMGTAVAIDNLSILTGAPGNDAVGSNAGAAYIFGVAGPIIGDLDGDGDVDLDDISLFAGCLNGPELFYPPNCYEADLNSDAAADLADFAVLQRAIDF